LKTDPYNLAAVIFKRLRGQSRTTTIPVNSFKAVRKSRKLCIWKSMPHYPVDYDATALGYVTVV